MMYFFIEMNRWNKYFSILNPAEYVMWCSIPNFCDFRHSRTRARLRVKHLSL